MQDMLMHSGPLGLAHSLLNEVLLPFGHISSEDHELMQLKTVSKSSPPTWTPPCGHLTIHSSPQFMLVHHAANLMPLELGLQITRQEITQKLICLGNSLVVSLLGFFEHLLGLAELQLVGLVLLFGT
jgi:hypothetical protein